MAYMHAVAEPRGCAARQHTCATATALMEASLKPQGSVSGPRVRLQVALADAAACARASATSSAAAFTAALVPLTAPSAEHASAPTIVAAHTDILS